MPYKDPAVRNARVRELRNTPEGKEKRRLERKKYYEKYKQRENKRLSDYNKTEKGKRQQTIRRWRSMGIIERYEGEHEDMYYFKEKYPYCMDCRKLFKSSYDKCLDHDHKTGFYRAILCRGCNVRRK